MQGLNTLEVKDSDLEASLVALDTALHDLDALPDVEAEQAAALAAREALQQRVAAQQALEDTMSSVRGISKAEGAVPSSYMPPLLCLHSTAAWPCILSLPFFLRRLTVFAALDCGPICAVGMLAGPPACHAWLFELPRQLKLAVFKMIHVPWGPWSKTLLHDSMP